MFAQLLKLPWSAFRHGRIHGIPVTRNPVAWIPYFLALPLVFLGWLLFFAIIYPVLMVLMVVGLWKFSRNTATFSESGVTFTKAYGRQTIPWTEIREVVRHRGPIGVCYHLMRESGGESPRELILSSTPDDEAFERTLSERGVHFSRRDWRYTTESTV
ncbi:MAG: hypothetical protein ACM3U2_06805 [Deltaproteobacteria bacterium]